MESKTLPDSSLFLCTGISDWPKFPLEVPISQPSPLLVFIMGREGVGSLCPLRLQSHSQVGSCPVAGWHAVELLSLAGASRDRHWTKQADSTGMARSSEQTHSPINQQHIPPREAPRDTARGGGTHPAPAPELLGLNAYAVEVES